jgi:hypothetical protein
MSNIQLTHEQRELLENPDIPPVDIYEIRRIVHSSEKYSDEDIHVIKDAIIRNKFWGHHHHIILNTDDPRLLIPFLDDTYPHEDLDLAVMLMYAIVFDQFEKARILIEYGADIEASRKYVNVYHREQYEDNLSKFISPAVKSANKV